MKAHEFLKRVDNATLAAMAVLAPNTQTMTAAEYLLLDQEIGDAIRAAFKKRVTVKPNESRHAGHYAGFGECNQRLRP